MRASILLHGGRPGLLYGGGVTHHRLPCQRVLFVAGMWALLECGLCAAGPGAVDFQREILPVLSKHCFQCHGPDESSRKGGLRLDAREHAVKPAKSGERAVVPGRPSESELLRRIHAADEDDLMPPPETKKPLTAQQKELLRQWIAAGADYTPHWAFKAPSKPSLPRVKDRRWPANEIDHFVLARLEKEGLKPSPVADRYTLVRRLYLDLIGLPPTPEEAESFVKER